MDEIQTTQPNQVQTGKSADPLKMWLIVVIVLLLVAGGFAAWQTVQLNSQNAKVSSLESVVNGLQNSNDELQTEVDSLKGDSKPTTTSSADADKILAATDAYVRAPVSATGKFEYNITKNSDDFAKVSVGVEEGGGYQLWLKKVGDNWTVLFGGQDVPAQEELSKYGIPNNF